MRRAVLLPAAAILFVGPTVLAFITGGYFEAPRLVATTPWIWVGLALFGLAAILWLMVLSRAALSFAYPFAALTYVVIVTYDAFRNEPVGALRWSGALLIVAGILLVSRTSHTS